MGMRVQHWGGEAVAPAAACNRRPSGRAWSAAWQSHQGAPVPALRPSGPGATQPRRRCPSQAVGRTRWRPKARASAKRPSAPQRAQPPRGRGTRRAHRPPGSRPPAQTPAGLRTRPPPARPAPPSSTQSRGPAARPPPAGRARARRTRPTRSLLGHLAPPGFGRGAERHRRVEHRGGGRLVDRPPRARVELARGAAGLGVGGRYLLGLVGGRVRLGAEAVDGAEEDVVRVGQREPRLEVGPGELHRPAGAGEALDALGGSGIADARLRAVAVVHVVVQNSHALQHVAVAG
eukprot:scaffold9_cov97-Isochrysis_galbana.AAC.4